MSGAHAAPPRAPPPASVAIPIKSSSVWDRITNWASENKAIVYTITGVAVVVTGAGVVYYLNDSVSTTNLTAISCCPKRKEKK